MELRRRICCVLVFCFFGLHGGYLIVFMDFNSDANRLILSYDNSNVFNTVIRSTCVKFLFAQIIQNSFNLKYFYHNLMVSFEINLNKSLYQGTTKKLPNDKLKLVLRTISLYFVLLIHKKLGFTLVNLLPQNSRKQFRFVVLARRGSSETSEIKAASSAN